ncbi:MAG: helix-turn-helix transcriptional regulator [Pseudomonadota bacterium]
MKIEDFSNLIFNLTNSAIGLNPDEHQAAQIEILQQAIPFDAAWWGWSNFSSGRNHLINTGLFNLPRSYDSAIRAVLHVDPLIKTARSRAIYGKAIDVENADLPSEFRKALEAFQIRSILNGHCRLQGETDFNFFLSLYKRDAGPSFSDADSRTYRMVLRHIEQNLSLSFRAEVRSLAPDGGEAAVISEGGAVVRATRGFKDKFNAENVGGKAHAILSDLSFGSGRWVGKHIVLDASRYKPGMTLVRMSANTVFARLSPQERAVASALAKGKSMRQIAEDRGVSHNTVRNQVAAIYKKIGASNRVSFLTKTGLGKSV